MDPKYELVIIVIILILIFYLGTCKGPERFNSTYYQSSLENDMATIKDNKGYTLEDYILNDNVVYKKPIVSPFNPNMVYY